MCTGYTLAVHTSPYNAMHASPYDIGYTINCRMMRVWFLAKHAMRSICTGHVVWCTLHDVCDREQNAAVVWHALQRISWHVTASCAVVCTASYGMACRCIICRGMHCAIWHGMSLHHMSWHITVQRYLQCLADQDEAGE